MNERTRELLERIRRFAMPEGPVQCRGTWLRQVGEMRFAPDRPWFPFQAEQWFEGDGIEFRWKARAKMAPLLRASVTDAFEAGRGLLAVRFLGVIPVARSRGPATDKGEAMRASQSCRGGRSRSASRPPSPGRWRQTVSGPNTTTAEPKPWSTSKWIPMEGSSAVARPAGRAWSARWSWTPLGRGRCPTTRSLTASASPPGPRSPGCCPRGRSRTGEPR